VSTDLSLYIGENVIDQLIDYCNHHQLERFMLVADENTYPVLGQAVEAALIARRCEVKSVILSGREVIADEHYLVQVLLQADRSNWTYLAVGSGTITDIVRIISHRTKASFISLPTAPSVDGFTSIGAPLVVGGLKQTYSAQPPLAVLADLETLRTAPRPLIAAGLGDLLGKYTSLADWRLGQLLWDEPYSVEVARRARQSVEACAQQAEAIGRASAEAIRLLMEGLLESGLCMLEFGNSRPASGAEHHLSHYWEMKLLQEKRPAILHGAKVGVATVLVARRYQEIRQLTPDQVAERLKAVPFPDRQQEIRQIETGYPPAVARQIMVDHAPFLELTAPAYEQLQQKIVAHWSAIQEIAASVPAPQMLIELLRQVDGPTEPAMLGLAEQEVRQARQYSHYLRNRFTVMKLSRMLGLP
jgi:glycerol-1-phosphate dehydrogenase [NAD(P)+]